MKITLEFDDAALPEQFKGNDGYINLIAFFHDNLVCNPMDVQSDNMVKEHYLKVFYDKQGLDGQAWIDAISSIDEANVALGRLLLDSMKVER